MSSTSPTPHLNKLGIEGNADDPDGVHFTDDRGRPLDPTGRPILPGARFDIARELGIPAGAWSHPSGERLEPWWVHLNERAG